MKWINVNNKLPEEYNAVLIYGVSQNKYYYNTGVGWLCGSGKYKRWISVCNIYPVTHWAELPNPPQDEQ